MVISTLQYIALHPEQHFSVQGQRYSVPSSSRLSSSLVLSDITLPGVFRESVVVSFNHRKAIFSPHKFLLSRLRNTPHDLLPMLPRQPPSLLILLMPHTSLIQPKLPERFPHRLHNLDPEIRTVNIGFDLLTLRSRVIQRERGIPSYCMSALWAKTVMTLMTMRSGASTNPRGFALV